MGKLSLAFLSLGLMTAVAVAQPLIETEPNDTAGDAMFIDEAFYPFGAVAIDGVLCEPDDAADYFSFDLLDGYTITASAFSLSVGGNPALTLYAPDGSTVVAANDDAYGLNPFLGATVASGSGLYYVAVTEGAAGGPCFDYKLAVAINIPEPATMSLLALGAFGLVRRRTR